MPRSTALVGLALLLVASLALLWAALGGASRAHGLGPGAVAAAPQASGSSLTAESEAGALGTAPPPSAERRSSLAPLASASELAAEEPPPFLCGRVVDRAGAPVGGARVLLGPLDWRRVPLDVERRGARELEGELLETATDDEGRFAFEEELGGARLRLLVRAAGCEPRRASVPVEDDPPTDVGDLALAPGAVLTGRVVDRVGNAVAGAAILQSVERGVGGLTVTVRGRGIPLAATDAEGRFRVDELVPGPWSLVFDAPGYEVRAERGRIERPGQPPEERLVVLDRGEAIAGRVIGAPEHALANLWVEARPTVDDPAGEAAAAEAPGADEVVPRARAARVGAGGEFRVAGLHAGSEQRLTVWEERAEGRERVTEVAPRDAPAGTLGVELEFTPQATLAFRVVDGASGDPVTRFLAWAGFGDGRRPLEDEAGEPLAHHPGGAVRFEELPAPLEGGEARLVVRAPGFAEHVSDGVRLAAGEERDLGTIELGAAPALRVRVLDDASGAPLEGARVFHARPGERGLEWRAAASDPREDERVRFGRTGADGRVSLCAIVGEPSVVLVAADGHVASERVELDLAPPAEREVEVRMQSGGTLRAVVVDRDGRPVVGAVVERKLDDENGSYGFGGEDGRRTSDRAGVATYECLPQGDYAFRVLEEEARVARFGRPEQEPSWTPVFVREGGAHELTLISAPRGSLAGTLTEARLPLAGANLHLVSPETAQGGAFYFGRAGEDPYAVVSSHDGAFRFADVRCGSYDLVVAHPERATPAKVSVEVLPEGTSQDVELPLALLEGTVTDADGQPLAGIEVGVEAQEQRLLHDFGGETAWSEDPGGSLRPERHRSAPRRTLSDDRGRYELRGVSTGVALDLRARDDYVVPGTIEDVEVAPDEIRSGLDFALERAGCIDVRVASPGEGSLLVDAVRVASGGEETRVRSSVWRGRRTLSSLPPGTWKVTLIREGRELASREVEVVAGRSVELGF